MASDSGQKKVKDSLPSFMFLSLCNIRTRAAILTKTSRVGVINLERKSCVMRQKPRISE